MKKVYGIIYRITNIINGKIYIGQTTRSGGFDSRYNNNIELNTHNAYLKKSIKKYGIENFKIEKEFDIAYSKEDLNSKEIYYIQKFKSDNCEFGYNMKSGGHNGKLSNNAYAKIYKNHNKVLDVTTGEIFLSVSEASKSLKVSEGIINSVCSFIRENIIDEYGIKHRLLFFNQDNQNSYHKKLVVCTTTNKIFESISSASRYYNCNKSMITKCCQNNTKSAGKHPETGELLKWMYYEDYLK